MLSNEVRNYMKGQLGMSDEDLDSMGPGYVRLYSEAPNMRKWKIIAEVTESKFCSHGCKVGDKFVFTGHLVNAEESTCPLCMGALAPLLERIHIMWDRMIDGRDPNDLFLQTSHCTDAGLEHGGLGRVYFKVYAEKE